MQHPLIQLRRHPLISLSAPVAGLALTAAGIWVEELYLIAPGVLLIIVGALMIVTPVVVIDQEKIEVKNLFGMNVGSWPHDGLEHLSVEEDKLYITREGRRAHLKVVVKARLHPLDWKFMLGMLEKAKEMAEKARKKDQS